MYLQGSSIPPPCTQIPSDPEEMNFEQLVIEPTCLHNFARNGHKERLTEFDITIENKKRLINLNNGLLKHRQAKTNDNIQRFGVIMTSLSR